MPSTLEERPVSPPVSPGGSQPGQAALPHGWAGRVMGRLMGFLNADMERTVIDQLALTGGERVLEIGFGSGVGIALLARQLPRGHVAGIDPSPEMIAQAGGRVRHRLAAGHVDLRRGTASALPWDDGAFDAVCSVNNIQLWASLDHDLQEVRRVLRPGGTLAIGVHAWALRKELFRDAPDDEHALRHLAATIAAAGFLVDRAWVARARSGPAAYVVARRGA